MNFVKETRGSSVSKRNVWVLMFPTKITNSLRSYSKISPIKELRLKTQSS